MPIDINTMAVGVTCLPHGCIPGNGQAPHTKAWNSLQTSAQRKEYCCKAYKSFRMPTAASTDSTPCQAECLGAPLSLLSTDLLLHHHSAVKCQLIILSSTGCRYDLFAQSLFTSLRGLTDASHTLLSAGHTPSCICDQSESHKRSVSTHCSSKQSTMLSIIERHAYSVR